VGAFLYDDVVGRHFIKSVVALDHLTKVFWHIAWPQPAAKNWTAPILSAA
jgi:hypothetical protein